MDRLAGPPTAARTASLRRHPDRREADGRVVVARGEGPGQHGGRRHEGVRHPRGGDPLLRRAPPRLAVTHPCQRARTNAPQTRFAMGNVDGGLAAPGGRARTVGAAAGWFLPQLARAAGAAAIFGDGRPSAAGVYLPRAAPSAAAAAHRAVVGRRRRVRAATMASCKGWPRAEMPP
jgi:hypothetical protein